MAEGPEAAVEEEARLRLERELAEAEAQVCAIEAPNVNSRIPSLQPNYL